MSTCRFASNSNAACRRGAWRPCSASGSARGPKQCASVRRGRVDDLPAARRTDCLTVGSRRRAAVAQRLEPQDRAGRGTALTVATRPTVIRDTSEALSGGQAPSSSHYAAGTGDALARCRGKSRCARHKDTHHRADRSNRAASRLAGILLARRRRCRHGARTCP